MDYDYDTAEMIVTMERMHDIIAQLPNMYEGEHVDRVKVVPDPEGNEWDKSITDEQRKDWEKRFNLLLKHMHELDAEFHGQFDCP
jgi:hypothetical protein